jgi:hypothetical protein
MWVKTTHPDYPLVNLATISHIAIGEFAQIIAVNLVRQSPAIYPLILCETKAEAEQLLMLIVNRISVGAPVMELDFWLKASRENKFESVEELSLET